MPDELSEVNGQGVHLKSEQGGQLKSVQGDQMKSAQGGQMKSVQGVRKTAPGIEPCRNQDCPDLKIKEKK